MREPDAAASEEQVAEPVQTETPNQRPVLEMADVSTHYGLVSVLRNVNIQIYAGEIVCLLGGNASGKTTTLKTILGMVVPSEGQVRLDGEDVTGASTSDVVARGISMVPENRRLFGKMTVKENLELGAYQRHDKLGIRQDLDRILVLFPRLKERLTVFHPDKHDGVLDHLKPEGDSFFPPVDPAIWREVEREAHPAGPDDHAGYDFVSYLKAAGANPKR